VLRGEARETDMVDQTILLLIAGEYGEVLAKISGIRCWTLMLVIEP
jgi:hypothetical protein